MLNIVVRGDSEPIPNKHHMASHGTDNINLLNRHEDGNWVVWIGHAPNNHIECGNCGWSAITGWIAETV